MEIKKAIAVTVSSSRSPFELYMLVACIASGVSGLFSPVKTSPAIAKVLPFWEIYFWYGGLILGGSIAFVAVLGKTLTSLYVERVGLTLLTGLCAAYGLAVIATTGYKLAFAVVFVVAFGVACAFRMKQIGRDLKNIGIVLREDQP